MNRLFVLQQLVSTGVDRVRSVLDIMHLLRERAVNLLVRGFGGKFHATIETSKAAAAPAADMTKIGPGQS